MSEPIEEKQLVHIKKDDLFTMARAIELALYTIQDLDDEYFGKYNSECKEDQMFIAYEFVRNQAKVEIITDYLLQASRELTALNVKCFPWII